MKRILLLLLALLMVFFLSACRFLWRLPPKPSPGPDDRNEATGVLMDEIQEMIESGRYSDDIVEILRSFTYQEPADTSFRRIETAFEEGLIDRETKAMRMLQALYLPQDLPREFRGEEEGKSPRSLKGEIQWLIIQRDELDSGTASVVLPFLVSAGDPESFFHPANREAGSTRKDWFPRRSVLASEDGDGQWLQSEVAVSGPSDIIIRFSRMEQLPQVQMLQEAVERSWQMFNELLGIQPTRDLNIFLVPGNLFKGEESDTYGDATYYSMEGSMVPTKYEIRIRDDLDADTLQSTMAHELFHVFQFEMGLTWFPHNTGLEWLIEATAVWSEHHVYRNYNKEHEYLQEFGQHLVYDRLSTSETREYGSYLLFLYLSESAGNPGHVAQVLWEVAGLPAFDLQMASTASVGATLMNFLDDTFGLKEFYGGFAVANWNLSPYRKYLDVDRNNMPAHLKFNPTGHSIILFRYLKDADTKPVAVSPHLEHVTTVHMVPRLDQYYSVQQRGGINYLLYLFEASPDEIQKVKFDFREEELAEPTPPGFNDMEQVTRHALVKIGDVWKPEVEDWSDLEYREFCRQNPLENVTALVLIYANADLHQEDYSRHSYMVDARGRCAGLKGTAQSRSESGMGIEKTDLLVKDELAHCPVCDAYVLLKTEVEYRYDYSVLMGDEIYGSVTTSTIGTGSFIKEYDWEEDCDDHRHLRRLVVDWEERTVDLYLGTSFGEDWISVTTSLTIGGITSTETEWKGDSWGVGGEGSWKEGTTAYYEDGVSRTAFCEITDTHVSGNMTILSELGAEIVYTFHYTLTQGVKKQEEP